MDFIVTALLLAAIMAVASALPHNSTFTCTSEGRFADPADCTHYFTCLAMPNGLGFESTHGSCFGHAFHPVRRTCVALDKVPGCEPSREARRMSSSDHLNSLCIADGFICLDCKTVINCISGRAFVAPSCAAGFSCTDINPPSFGGSAVCYDIHADLTACNCLDANAVRNENSFSVDPYNTNGFIFCPDSEADPLVHKCPMDMSFDMAMSKCTSDSGLPTCTEEGVYADPGACATYYTCIQTKEGWVQNSFECATPGDMYNENDNECSNPCNWPTRDFVCDAEGRFADPSNCNNYISCITDPADTNAYIKTVSSCPEEFEWDTVSTPPHCGPPNTCTPVFEHSCSLIACTTLK